MKNSTRTASRLSDKKESILKAAAFLFAERGFAAVSMRDLAQEIHTTPAALYHHFQDKAAIHLATLQYVFSGKATDVSDLIKRDDAPEVKLERLIVWFTLQFAQNPIMMRLLQRELLDGDKQQIKVLTEDVITAPLLEIERLMQQLAPGRDARPSAFSIVSLIVGFVELSPVLEQLTGRRSTRKSRLDFANHATHLVLSGLVAQPETEGVC